MKKIEAVIRKSKYSETKWTLNERVKLFWNNYPMIFQKQIGSAFRSTNNNIISYTN